MDDHALLAEFTVRGNADALAELVRRYQPLVRAAARRQVADDHLAQDITQSTMMTLMRKARRIPSGTPLGPWLLRVTYYLATDALRDESARRRHECVAARQRQESSEASPWRSLEPVLDQTLNEMRRKDRTILILRYLQEWSLPRIASELSLTPTATRQRLSRALRRLRDRLARRGVGSEDLAILLPLLPAQSGEFVAREKPALYRPWRLLHLKALMAVVAVAMISGGFVAARAAFHRTPAGLSANPKSNSPPPPVNSRPNSTIP
jgi:RNA polymerase sigma factor (sigma-70 family)